MQKREVNMIKSRHIIREVEEGSIAWELELEPGDELLSINGKHIEDVFDYHYLVNDEYIVLLVKKANGEEWELEVEKEYEEDLGIIFENSLMDEYRSCSNHCIFCFIDQMPPGMRETLYFKDDDSRLSFLQGNYVTLTNMKDHDIDRIIEYHLAPINISFHTTNPALRCKMLRNRFAGDIFPKVDRLFQAGIEMNGQIVLCKGINDGEELERSLKDLSSYLPYLKSVSIVPVGLSLENGVGMLRLLEEQAEESLREKRGDDRKIRLSFATGRLAYPFISRYMQEICKKFPNVQVRGYGIRNNFFGEKITVSGLLTGQDIVKQLKGKELGEYLLLPCNLLRSGENVFLDDMTVEEVEKELEVPVKIVGEEGADLIEAVLNREAGGEHKRRQMYEQTDCSYSGTAECGEVYTF